MGGHILYYDKLYYEINTTNFAEGNRKLQDSYTYTQILKFAWILPKKLVVSFLY